MKYFESIYKLNDTIFKCKIVPNGKYIGQEPNEKSYYGAMIDPKENFYVGLFTGGEQFIYKGAGELYKKNGELCFKLAEIAG